MPLRLYDSLTREVRDLTPSPDGIFRFYNCGPTVYDAAHIGNFRAFVINDVIRRLLELEFGADRVRHVRNITDVDDKTIRRAANEGRPLAEVTRQWTEKFHADCTALNCLPPHVEPTATGHIAEQIAMIAELERGGHAYRAEDGSVYFKVASFPEYGRLSRVKERDLKPGGAHGPHALGSATADADEKEDLSDFALWKGRKPEDGPVAWPSPWGEGRPGWHIECSAMSKKHLGDTIDLHTGGVDLLFPHHENEIAQSECCNHRPLARVWFHNEFLLVDGQKMSKRLGNMYTLGEIVDRGFSAAAFRYALLSGHPRKQLNFTFDSVHAAESALKTLRAYRAQLQARTAATAESAGAATVPAFESALSALRDDLNTPAALGALFTAINAQGGDRLGPQQAAEALAQFDRTIFALGLDLSEPKPSTQPIPAAIAELAERRWQAKRARDFAAADALRREIAAAGWSMLDGKETYRLEKSP